MIGDQGDDDDDEGDAVMDCAMGARARGRWAVLVVVVVVVGDRTAISVVRRKVLYCMSPAADGRAR